MGRIVSTRGSVLLCPVSAFFLLLFFESGFFEVGRPSIPVEVLSSEFQKSLAKKVPSFVFIPEKTNLLVNSYCKKVKTEFEKFCRLVVFKNMIPFVIFNSNFVFMKTATKKAKNKKH